MLFNWPFCEDVLRLHPPIATRSEELVVTDIFPPLPTIFGLDLTPLSALATADIRALAVSVVRKGGAVDECTLPEVTMPRLAVEVVNDVLPFTKDCPFLPRSPDLADEGSEERPKALGPDSLWILTVGTLGWASGMFLRTNILGVREAVFLGINDEFSDIFKLKFMSSTCGSTCKNGQCLKLLKM